MKLLWRMGKEALRYRTLYVIAILSTFALTLVNLAAPRVLSLMTGTVAAGVEEGDLPLIGWLTLGLTGLYVVRVLFRYLSNFLSHKAAWFLVGDLRSKLYEKLQTFSMSFYQDKQTGDLMSRVVNDTRDFELLYAHSIPEMITNVVTVSGVLIILLTINWKLALLTCCPIPLVALSGWVFAKRIGPYFQVAQRTTGELNAKLQDNLSGMQEIRAFVKEEEEYGKVHGKVWENVETMLKSLKLSGIFHPMVEFMSSIGTVIVVGVGGLLAYRNNLSVSDVVAFLLYLAMFYMPISGLARMLEDTQQTYAGAQRVMLILGTPVDIADEPDAEDPEEIRGAVSFRDVSFDYGNGVPILKDITFDCEPGQMLAIVGPTGVGKTTLTQLISRSYDPKQGAVLVDGRDVRKLTLRSLRSHIAPVLQDTFLFNATVGENIGYARGGATREEIVAAAKAAHIHEDIMSMPEQYDTKVGERGMRLSGGQKQRIAIARAILCNAPIIILDEATASVDAETEREIQAAIDGLAGSRTVIVIAHRLSTVRNADAILVLQDGVVVERGSHRELIEKKGAYYRMYEAQDLG